MFVDDAPRAVHFSQAHGQAKLQFFAVSFIGADAVPDGGGEGYVLSGGDFYVAKVEGNGTLGARVEQVPGLHVRVQPTREQRRRDVEHQHVSIVVGADGGQVLVSNGFCPLVDEGTNLLLIA